MFTGTLFFLLLYVYSTIINDSSSGGWLVFMIAGSALSGIAESLPKERRRVVGLFRVSAILVLMCLLAITVFAPETIVGEW